MGVNVKRDESLPDHVRGLPLETQVAVLYERVRNVSDDVQGLKNLIKGAIATLLTGIILAAIGVAAGFLGPHSSAAFVWRLFT